MEIHGTKFTSIPGCPAYLVNKQGQIWSTIRDQFMKPLDNGFGYKYVKLRHIDSVFRLKAIHRLVMLTFVGPSELPVNHKDGDKSNNALSNLEYCTPQENTLHGIYVLKTINQKGRYKR